jgi:hypothetical protein
VVERIGYDGTPGKVSIRATGVEWLAARTLTRRRRQDEQHG